MSTSLKLCVVGLALLAGCTQAMIADDWAHKVCKVVEALPYASASQMPSGSKVVLTVTPEVASAVVTGPDGSAKAFQAQMK